ncbi:hypothetical protein QYE76_055960 [Lolium multiflorum]|uniref:Retrotransposon gag domain-containing protein n=1 Tax=Lolium multiflorum TaxID=4521 RepID=A0AAD8T0P2_LOLMU|nr:hypothetical protein QYE76_055960 [Lolium multiflorum]
MVSASDQLRVRFFSQSLTGPAFGWYTSLQPNSVRSWKQLEEQFHTQYHSEATEAGIAELAQVRQKRGETVSEYIQRFRTVKNRCYSVHLTEKEAVELAVAGLAASFKDLTFQVEYNLAHLVQRLTLYEQRHPELYQDKFKRAKFNARRKIKSQSDYGSLCPQMGLVGRHGKDKAESSHSRGKDKSESSHSRGKDKEEAVPRDRPQDDDRRYLTEEEVRSIRYQRPLSVHLLNKYEQRYDRRRRHDEDDERYRRSDAADRRYRQHDRNNDGYERHARGRSREQDNMDKHWNCPFFKHCWDSGMSRLPTINRAKEVSVFERLGPLPPHNKQAGSSQEEDFEESDEKKIGITDQGGALMDSAILRSVGCSGCETWKKPRHSTCTR